MNIQMNKFSERLRVSAGGTYYLYGRCQVPQNAIGTSCAFLCKMVNYQNV